MVEVNMKQAVILVNLGTPSEPTAKGVRRFLKAFLSDQRVVEVPKPIWWFVLRCFILPFRSPKVAEAYLSIWWDGGSPLRVITESQEIKLQQSLIKSGHDNIIVKHAMTYCDPSIESVIAQLKQENCKNIIILPLYPQFSATTTASIYDQVSNLTKKSRDIPPVSIINNYHDHAFYIDALAKQVKKQWQEKGKSQRLLMSFHGIPKRNVDLGDPYYIHCANTATLLAEALNLEKNEWIMTFQSRFGPAEWLQPYTVDVLTQWGKENLDSLDVICPAFAADCLETLEEMQIENKHIYEEAGGKNYSFIPCLNDSEDHIKMLEKIVIENMPSIKKS